MPILRLITAKRTMGLKLESTFGVAETLTSADYDFGFYDVQYSPEIEEYVRKLARGDFSRDKSVPGRRKFTVTCKHDLQEGSAAATPPQYWQALRACGMKQQTYGSTGVALTPHADYGNISATIEIVERQEGSAPKGLVLTGIGMTGNAKLVLSNVGQPIAIEFEFQGALQPPSERAFASMITPTGFDTAQPAAVLSATINLFATTQYLGKLTIDLGNKVEMFSDPTKGAGYDGAHIVDREAMLELDPDMVTTGDINLFTDHINATTGQLSITVGSKMTISAPAAQYIQTYNPGDREGHVVNNLRCRLTRGSVGNDEFEILQGQKS